MTVPPAQWHQYGWQINQAIKRKTASKGIHSNHIQMFWFGDYSPVKITPKAWVELSAGHTNVDAGSLAKTELQQSMQDITSDIMS